MEQGWTNTNARHPVSTWVDNGVTRKSLGGGDGRCQKCVLETPGSRQVWCDGERGMGCGTPCRFREGPSCHQLVERPLMAAKGLLN